MIYRLQSQKGCRVFVGLLLAVMLAFGVVGRVPVARASAQTLCIMAPPWQIMGGYTAGVGYIRAWAGTAGYDCMYGPYYSDIAAGFSWTLDGVTNPIGCTFGPAVGTAYPTESTFYIGGFQIRTGSAEASKFTDGAYHTVTWSSGTQTADEGAATFAAGSWTSKWNPTTTYKNTYTSQANWGQVYVLPSVSITGPAMVETGQSGTWTATAAGGTAPYTYQWYLLPAGSSLLGDDPGLIATGTASTFTHTMTVAGAFQVSLTVLDSTGAAVAATATVNVGATLGTGYRIEFARSGTRGLYLAVTVYDGITGIVSPIASTSGTQAGWYDDWGTTTNSFHWVASPSEAVWWQAFSWRWTLRFAYPDGSLGPPPEDFWFQTTITLTNGTHLSVMHHFSTYGENSDTWTDDTGAVAVPETPPAAESSLPAWVQALLDGFKAVIRSAFVPSATDFSSQVAQGWVVITSPVPTIVPQYTIPFPNPNHLLASTGDSVNIDFSMISTWTYYATVKALVQVCLDAVLVFIVIGIVT